MVLTLLHGAYCVMAQAVLLREWGDLFKGNEAVLGLLLTAWFCGGGIGTWLFTRMPRRWMENPRGPAAALFFSSLTLPLAVFATRVVFSVFRFQALPGLPGISILAILLTAPVGATAGFTFSFLAQKAFPSEKGDMALAYLYEAAGAFGGGILYAFALVGRVDGLEIGLWITFVPLAFIMISKRNSGEYKSLVILALWLVLVYFGSGIAVLYSRMEQFRGSKLMEVSQSRYGALERVADAGQTLAYYNGEVMFDPRTVSWEEEAFLPALLREKTEKILIPGFPPPPLIQELFRLNPAVVTSIFPDRNLYKFLMESIRKMIGAVPPTRLETVLTDPFRNLQTAGGPFDLILLSKDFPRSVSENRFFSYRFLENLRDRLAPGGMVALSLPYEENLPDSGTLRGLRILRRTLESAYPYVAFVPGERFYLLASGKPFNFDPQKAIRRWEGLQINTGEINSAWITHYLDPSRIKRFDDWTKPSIQDPLNNASGSALYRASFSRWIRKDSGSAWVIPLFLSVILLFLLLRRWQGLLGAFKAGKRSMALFLAGFAVIAIEVPLLEDYQGLCGYLFERFSVLTGAFMLGTALGAWAVLRYLSGMEEVNRWSKGFALSLLGLVLWGACSGLLRGMNQEISFLWVDALAISLNLLGGAFSGVFFTLVVRESGGQIPASEAGTSLYAFDLFGSGLAALLVPFVLIPLGGTSLAQTVGATVAAGLSLWEWRRSHGA